TRVNRASGTPPARRAQTGSDANSARQPARPGQEPTGQTTGTSLFHWRPDRGGTRPGAAPRPPGQGWGRSKMSARNLAQPVPDVGGAKIWNRRQPSFAWSWTIW